LLQVQIARGLVRYNIEHTTRNCRFKQNPESPFWQPHHVQKFLQAGILKQTRTQARAGRAIRYYRTVADQFLIPTRVLPLEVLLRTDDQSHKNFQAIMVKQWLNGSKQNAPNVIVYRHEQRMHIADVETALGQAQPDDNEPPGMSLWLGYHLSLEQAKRLRDDLLALDQKYRRLSRDSQQRYVLRLGLLAIDADLDR
jgi:hypothetical protein